MTSKALHKQVSGTHYMYMEIQPAEFINKNKLLFAEGNAIKYICRHSRKGGIEDIDKAIHYLEMIKARDQTHPCLLYTSPSPRDRQKSRMPSSA